MLQKVFALKAVENMAFDFRPDYTLWLYSVVVLPIVKLH
jgi:hypothetical protein